MTVGFTEDPNVRLATITQDYCEAEMADKR